MRRVKGMLIGVAMLLTPGIAATGEASPITYYFGGQLDFVSSCGFGCAPLTPYFAVGDAFAGSFTFESTTVDGNATASTGSYAPGPAFSIAINSYVFSNSTIGGSGSVQVKNDIGTDQFSANAETDSSPIAGFLSQVFALQLQDSGSTAFASDALPLNGLNLGAFDFSSFELVFQQNTPPFNTGSIRGGLDYLSLTDPSAPAPVPEPASILLVGSGVLALARRRWRAHVDTLRARMPS
jgi:hypothetical protein